MKYLSCLGVLQTAERTDRLTDIYECRVAFATENCQCHLANIPLNNMFETCSHLWIICSPIHNCAVLNSPIHFISKCQLGWTKIIFFPRLSLYFYMACVLAVQGPIKNFWPLASMTLHGHHFLQMDPDHQECHLKWPESWTFELVTLKGIKNTLQSGITVGVLDFWKYVKRVAENC